MLKKTDYVRRLNSLYSTDIGTQHQGNNVHRGIVLYYSISRNSISSVFFLLPLIYGNKLRIAARAYVVVYQERNTL